MSLAEPSPAAIRAAEFVAACLGAGGSSGLARNDLRALAGHLSRRRLRAGQVAFRSAGDVDGVWVICRGIVELIHGHPVVVSQVLRSGDVFGDVPLLAGLPPAHYPRAVTATSCLMIPACEVRPLLLELPNLAQLWLSGLAARLHATQTRLLDALEGPLPRRAAALLLREAEAGPGSGHRSGVVRLPQATLAAMLGVPRSSLNRVLKRFETDGAISLAYRRIDILDVDRLMAEGRAPARAASPRRSTCARE